MVDSSSKVILELTQWFVTSNKNTPCSPPFPQVPPHSPPPYPTPLGSATLPNMDKLSIATFNTKGLRNDVKRNKVFSHFMQKIKSGVLMLQETHSIENDRETWSNELNPYKIYLNHGTSNSRGTLMAVSNNLSDKITQYSDDQKGRLQFLTISFDDEKFLFINIYNANTEKDQLEVLKSLNENLEKIDDVFSYNIVCGGDWNFYKDISLDTYGGSPKLKLKSIASLAKISETFDLCDIYRLRYPQGKKFSFRQSGRPRVLRRLDFFLVSNSIQERIDKVEILASISSDHSPVFLEINDKINSGRNNTYWKFNVSCLKEPTFGSKLSQAIEQWKVDLHFLSPQKKWERLKYYIRRFCIKFSKEQANERRQKTAQLEKVIKSYETDPHETPYSSEQYLSAKLEFENFLNQKTMGTILRSKIQTYENNEKSSKFFLSLEKKNAIQNTIKLLKEDEMSDSVEKNPKQISKKIKDFYSNLFKRQSNRSPSECANFLNSIDSDLPKVTDELNEMLKKPLTLTELETAIKNSDNGRSPGNDGLPREFYIFFWRNISEPLFNSLIEAKEKGSLATSQRQAVVKLLEKKGKDKRFIKNWRPISLINYDSKLLSKTLAERLKLALPFLVSSDQTAYVKDRFMGESVRLISDILEVTKSLNIDGYILTMDIQKAFDSVDHVFLIEVLKSLNFNEEFIDWIKTLMKNQESCVFNGGVSTGYFPLERGVRQGDPISAYLFILVMEIFFIMARKNEKIEKLEIFDFKYLLTSYADDSTFFVKNINSAVEIFNTFKIFSKFSGLNANKSKCEFAGIGAKNGAQTALPDVLNINLNSEAIKVLGVHFTYNERIFIQKNFIEVVKKIENVLAIWRWRNLSTAGKITVFKSLAFSKIVFISYLNTTPTTIIQKLENIQKDFIWNGKAAKIKHTTLISDYMYGGLKAIDIKSKLDSLHLSWVKRLYNDNFHPWKCIPRKFIHDKYNFNIFFPNAHIELHEKCPKFYHSIASAWSNITQNPLTAKTAASQKVWFNKFIKIGGMPVTQLFPEQIFVGDFLNGNKIATWPFFKNKYKLQNSDHFKWIQIVNAIPKTWIRLIENEADTWDKKIFREQHLMLLTRQLPLEKLTSKQLYAILIHQIRKPPSSQEKISSILNLQVDNWNDIYILARKVAVDSYTRMFQYKCSQNILYLNNQLSKMNLSNTDKCSLCNEHKETIKHLFYDCLKTKTLWLSLENRLNMQLPELTPESAFFGFPNADNALLAHLHLIFKIAIYTGREKGDCNLEFIVNKIKQIRKIEENIVYLNSAAKQRNKEKWACLNRILPR